MECKGGLIFVYPATDPSGLHYTLSQLFVPQSAHCPLGEVEEQVSTLNRSHLRAEWQNVIVLLTILIKGSR